MGVETHQSEGFSSDKETEEKIEDNAHKQVVQETTVEEIDEVSEEPEQIKSVEPKKMTKEV